MVHATDSSSPDDEYDQMAAVWPPGAAGQWELTFGWRTVKGKPEITKLVIKQADDKAPVAITGRSLRAVPINQVFSELLARARAVCEEAPDQAYDGEWTPEIALEPVGSFTVEGTKDDRRLQRLEEAARIYKQAVALGKKAPTKAVGEHLGMPRTTAANWVARCRQHGLLPPAEGRRVPPGMR